MNRRELMKLLSLAPAASGIQMVAGPASVTQKRPPMKPSQRIAMTSFCCTACGYIQHIDDTHEGKLLVAYFQGIEEGRLRLVECEDGTVDVEVGDAPA